MSIQSRLYQHSNFNGRSTFASLPLTTPPTAYLRISKGWLDAVDLHDRISSLRVIASRWEAGGRVILFQHSHFRGRYATFDANPGATVSVANLQAENFNDRTSSALIVRSGSQECLPLALGSLGTPDLRTQIRDLVSAIPKVRMRGDPIVTWDLWPNFSPSRKYVYVRIPIRVDINNWPDYDAEIRLWVYLYIDGAGKARGYAQWYGAWVEGGILTGKILDRLMNAIPGQIGTINAMISDSLDSLDTFDFVGLYYLPGTAGHTGHVEDDVTVVFVKAW